MIQKMDIETKFQVIFWRDIPAQVKVRIGRERSGKQLSDRFQDAIDQAAMYAGKTDSNEYLEEWRTSEWEIYSGSEPSPVDEIALGLETEFTQERLDQIAKRGGFEFLDRSRFQIVYWRDIPAQVKVRQGQSHLSPPLPDRFQDSIDRAMNEAGITDKDGRHAQRRTSEWEDRKGELKNVAETLIAEIDQAYPPERLDLMIAAKGYDDSSKDQAE